MSTASCSSSRMIGLLTSLSRNPLDVCFRSFFFLSSGDWTAGMVVTAAPPAHAHALRCTAQQRRAAYASRNGARSASNRDGANCSTCKLSRNPLLLILSSAAPLQGKAESTAGVARYNLGKYLSCDTTCEYLSLENTACYDAMPIDIVSLDWDNF